MKNIYLSPILRIKASCRTVALGLGAESLYRSSVPTADRLLYSKHQSRCLSALTLITAIMSICFMIVTVVLPLSRPITSNAADINIAPSSDTWEEGYINSNLEFTKSALPGGRVRYTSPFIGVTPGVTYTYSITAESTPYLQVTECSGGSYVRRQIISGQTVMTWTCPEGIDSVRLTAGDIGLSGAIFSYSPDALSVPPGTPQIYPDVHYGSDGDFVASGNEKHLMFYKYFPNDTDYVGISVYAVNNYGEQLKFRVIGYVHGNVVFRSGLCDYGDTVNIDGKNFDYFDIYLVNWSDEVDGGSYIPVGYVESFKYIYNVRYYVPDPTQPPGVIEELTPTDYVDLHDYDGVQPPTVPDLSGVQSPIFSIVPYIIGSLLGAYQYFVPVIGFTFIIWLLYDRKRGGGG